MSKLIKISPQEVGGKWTCPKCKTNHVVGIYMDLHMREGGTHTCPCGQKCDVRNWTVRPEHD